MRAKQLTCGTNDPLAVFFCGLPAHSHLFSTFYFGILAMLRGLFATKSEGDLRMKIWPNPILTWLEFICNLNWLALHRTCALQSVMGDAFAVLFHKKSIRPSKRFVCAAVINIDRSPDPYSYWIYLQHRGKHMVLCHGGYRRLRSVWAGYLEVGLPGVRFWSALDEPWGTKGVYSRRYVLALVEY